jgi:hypothetical protein
VAREAASELVPILYPRIGEVVCSVGDDVTEFGYRCSLGCVDEDLAVDLVGDVLLERGESDEVVTGELSAVVDRFDREAMVAGVTKVTVTCSPMSHPR